MQGYILKLTKSVREDLIVRLLTQNHYYTLYRFYGARHNILLLGRHVDFEIEYQGIYIPKLRHILHLPKAYEEEASKLAIWQKFCFLLDRHLGEAEGADPKGVPPFYYDLLEEGTRRLKRQDAQRVICYLYIELLDFEGRLYDSDRCFVCDGVLLGSVAVARGFLLAHPSCLPNPFVFRLSDIRGLYQTKNLINLSDWDCQALYSVIEGGL